MRIFAGNLRLNKIAEGFNCFRALPINMHVYFFKYSVSELMHMICIEFINKKLLINRVKHMHMFC